MEGWGTMMTAAEAWAQAASSSGASQSQRRKDLQKAGGARVLPRPEGISAIDKHQVPLTAFRDRS